MQFLHPTGFLLLGLIPVLLLIHSIRPKPKEVETTTLFLWQGALKEIRGGGRIQKLLQNLSLLLQILIVIVTSLALAEPVLLREGVVSGDVVLVVDVSAGMQARCRTGGTRLDRVKQEAWKRIDHLSSESRMLILEAAHRPRVLSAYSRDKELLRRVVKDVKVKEVEGDLEKALYLGLSFLGVHPEDRMVILTDGAWANVSPELRNHPKLVPWIVSEEGENVGITRFECRADPETEGLFQGWLEIVHFYPRPLIVPVQVGSKEQVLFRDTLQLKPWEKRQLLFPFRCPQSPVLTASLAVSDDLEADNHAYFILPTLEPVEVLWIGPGNEFLERILTAFPEFRVHRSKSLPVAQWAEVARKYDLIIVDGISPPPLTSGNFLLINAHPPLPEMSVIGQQTQPTVIAWAGNHPILRHLQPADFAIESAPRINTSSEWQAIVESREGGLIYIREGPGLRAVLINFDLRQSDFPRRAAFPILMADCFRWLQPYRHPEKPGQVKSGEPFHLVPRSIGPSALLIHPNGQRSILPLFGRPVLFQGTERVGIYQVQEGSKETLFAVNLLSMEEADLRIPPSLLQGNRSAEKPVKEGRSRAASLWFWILPLSLIFLFLEFHLWQKRR